MLILGLGRLNVHFLEDEIKTASDLDKVISESKGITYVNYFLLVETKLTLIFAEWSNLIRHISPTFQEETFHSVTNYALYTNLDYIGKLNFLYRHYALISKEEFNLLKELVEVRNYYAHNLYTKGKGIDKYLSKRPKRVKKFCSDDFNDNSKLNEFKKLCLSAYKILNRVEIVFSMITSPLFKFKDEVGKQIIELSNKKDSITDKEIFQIFGLPIIKRGSMEKGYTKQIIENYLKKIKSDNTNLWKKLKNKIIFNE